MKEISEKRILKSLMDISSFMNFVENPDLILSLIIEECVLLTEASWGVLLSYDSHLNLDAFQITKDLNAKKKEHLSSFLNNKIKEIVDKFGITAILEEKLWAKKDVQKLFKEAPDVKIRSILICPIKKKGELLGLAMVMNKRKDAQFTNSDKENFSIICQEASIVIENINLFKARLKNERLAAIGETMAGISHYIKNILQGVSAGSYLVDIGIENKDISSIADAWNVVNKNAKRISELVLDMLYYSKERKSIRQKIDPRVLIDDILGLVRPRLTEKNIKLKLYIKDLPRHMVVNEKGIHRSILDIITNAMEACDKKDSYIEFKVSLDKPSKALKIIVSDNGKGISKENIDRLFQPFYTNEKGEGTGLGLAITKKVVDEHDGSIKVESELSKGTTFEISIPVR